MSLITNTRTRPVSTATYGCSDRTPGIRITYPISAVDPADACLNTIGLSRHAGVCLRSRSEMHIPLQKCFFFLRARQVVCFDLLSVSFLGLALLLVSIDV